jgi:hypothetical protein
MFSYAVDRRTLRTLTLLIAGLNIGACTASSNADAAEGHNAAAAEVAAPAPAAEATDSATSANETADAAIPGESSGQEAPPERVHGHWRVIQETGGAGKSMVGKTLVFDDTALGWAGANGKAAPGCADPFYHVVSDASEVRSFSAPFKPAWSRFGLTPRGVGALHAWECGDGDATFGPEKPAGGSVFYPIGSDRLMMNWEGGNILLLTRQR